MRKRTAIDSPSDSPTPLARLVLASALLVTAACGAPTETDIATAALEEGDAFVATRAVGTMGGSASVDADGHFVYEVPIVVPPGRTGMQPSISLTYRSGSGESAVGLGWSVTGLSAVTRCPLTIAQDGVTRGVQLDADDAFCLDGQRLVARPGGSYGEHLSVHHTERESFRRITSRRDEYYLRGPSAFVVEMPNALRHFYGGTAAARIDFRPADNSLPIAETWMLARTEDRWGNVIEYTYDHVRPEDAGIVSPPEGIAGIRDLVQIARIDYTGSISATGIERGGLSVRFVYVSVAGPDSGFEHGFFGVGQNARRLIRVSTHLGDSLVREYRITASDANAQRQQRVERIQECVTAVAASEEDASGEMVCRPPTRFEYPSEPVALRPNTTYGHVDDELGYATFQQWELPLPRAEVLQHPCESWTPDVGPVAATSGGLCSTVSPFLATLDANGDGADDLVYADRTTHGLHIRWGEWRERAGASLDSAPLSEETRTSRALSDVFAFDGMNTQGLDWNLDGRDDLFVVSQRMEGGVAMTDFQILESTGTDFLPPRSVGIPRMPAYNGTIPSDHRYGYLHHVMLDMNGDGRRDVLACVVPMDCVEAFIIDGEGYCAGRWRYLEREDEGFALEETLDRVTPCGASRAAVPAVVGDFDGDGREELIDRMLWTGHLPRHPDDPETLSQRIIRLDPETDLLTDLPVDGVVGFGAANAGDVNGDGAHDLVTEVSTDVGAPGETRIALGTGILGRFLTAPGLSEDPAAGDRRRRVMARYDAPAVPLAPLGFDLDGDGRGDTILPNVGVDQQYPLDRGYGQVEYAPSAVTVISGAGLAGALTMETNATFRGDFIAPRSFDLVDYRMTYLRFRHAGMDVDGDGAMDLVEWADVEQRYLAERPPMRVFHNVRARPRASLVAAVVDGNGARTEIRYAPMSSRDVYVPATDCTYPQRCVTGSRMLVRELRRDDGIGGMRSIELRYEDARVDLQGRGWLGFGRRWEIDPARGATTVIEVDNRTRDAATQSYPLAGLTRRISTRQTADAAPGAASLRLVGSRTTHTRTVVHGMPGTYEVRELDRIHERFESMAPTAIGGPDLLFYGLTPTQTTHEEWLEHDAFGNAARYRSSDVEAAIVHSVHTEWLNDEESWLLGLPTHQISRDSAYGPDADRSCDTRIEVSYEVDTAHGVIASATRIGDLGGQSASVFIKRDERGHVTRVTEQSDEGERSTSYGYDSEESYYPTSETNALGHVMQLAHEPRMGLLFFSEDPNGVITRSRYDGFGRLRESETDGSALEEIDYLATGVPGQRRVESRSASHGLRATTLDVLGRAIRTEMELPFEISTSETTYDGLGRVTRVSEPHRLGEPATAFTLYEYDGLDRLRAVTGADPGNVTRFHHLPGVDVRVDASGAEWRTELDSRGLAVAQVEPAGGGRTEISYCPTGAPRSIRDAHGNTLWYEYDAWGRQAATEDPDAGRTEYAWSALGELIDEMHAASGRTLRNEYDDLGRLVRRTHVETGDESRWEYDTARTPEGRRVLGALAMQSSTDGVVDRFSYDSYGRTTGVERHVGGTTLALDFVYDDLGSIKRVVYPTAFLGERFAVERHFDPETHDVVALTAGGQPLWALDEHDARGAATHEWLGPIERVSSFTAAGRVERLTATRPGGALLQDREYEYDGRGFVEHRIDHRLSLVDELRYDDVGRLRARLRDGLIAESYTFDEIGTLTSSHDGSAGIDADTTPRGIDRWFDGMSGGHEEVDYDERGNVLEVGKTSLEYGRFDLPVRVTVGSGAPVRFEYDASGERARKVGETDTVYLAGLFERETRGGGAVERYLVSGPGGAIAQVEREGASSYTQRTRWLLTDVLGSVETAWVEGEPPEHVEYDSFGGVLAGASTTGQAPFDDVDTGFTGHSHDGDIGLVDMGGRIYHPRLRRFLQPDPVLNGAGHGLSPYGYALGNPTAWVDPSGLTVNLAQDTREPAYEVGPGSITFTEGGCVANCEDTAASDGSTAERGGAGSSGQAPQPGLDRSQLDAYQQWAEDMRDSYRRDAQVMAEVAEEQAFEQTAAAIAADAATQGLGTMYENWRDRPMESALDTLARVEVVLAAQRGDLGAIQQLADEGLGQAQAVADTVQTAAGPQASAERGAARATLALTAIVVIGAAIGGRGPQQPRPPRMRGPVTFLVPSWATPAQRQQMQAYVAGCNRALARGQLSTTGRVSTQGALRDLASAAARAERQRAALAGTPYTGAAGHVPDTAWTGMADPPEWMDLDPRINSSLGGQIGGYPVGFRPTTFRLEL